MIEWYDFYIFGSLAVTISPLFYPEGNDTLALIAHLSTFAVGFVVRPFVEAFTRWENLKRVLIRFSDHGRTGCRLARA